MFQSIELATADQRPDYMPYERVAFPRVTREAQTNPVAEMDAMWMVGFLDHEEKHGPSGPSAQTMKDYEVSLTLVGATRSPSCLRPMSLATASLSRCAFRRKYLAAASPKRRVKKHWLTKRGTA